MSTIGLADQPTPHPLELVSAQATSCAGQLTVAELQTALRAARGVHPAPTVTSHDVASVPVAIETLAVVSAHPGAGCSTVALAVADAASATQPEQLIEYCDAGRSGLAGAADRELGEVPGGLWRRGRRGPVIIDRLAGVERDSEPPEDAARVRVVDIGTGMGLLPISSAVVLVCRASVPGLRAAEGQLDALNERHVALAALGSARWPGVVRASAGPRISALRGAGRVITVPLDRRLAATGLTRDRLPRGVLAAAHRLLALTGSTTRPYRRPGRTPGRVSYRTASRSDASR